MDLAWMANKNTRIGAFLEFSYHDTRTWLFYIWSFRTMIHVHGWFICGHFRSQPDIISEEALLRGFRKYGALRPFDLSKGVGISQQQCIASA